MSLGNPTPVAGGNAANAASAATAPSSAGGTNANPLGGGLSELNSGFSALPVDPLFQDFGGGSSAQSQNTATTPVSAVAQTSPVAQSPTATAPTSTVGQAPPSVTNGAATLASIMQPVPTNPASFTPANSVPQNQPVSTAPFDPTSFLGAPVAGPVAQNSGNPLSTSFLSNSMAAM